MSAAATALDRGLNRLIYTREFLRTLRPKALQKLVRHPGLFEAEALRGARTFRRFDDLFIAPVHGFADAAEYWPRAGSKPHLNAILVPTLLINARNDPFLPSGALPRPHQVAPAVTLEFPAQGGHAGFPSHPPSDGLPWLPARILEFFGSAPAG